MSFAYINRIATAVPPNQVNDALAGFQRLLLTDDRTRMIFDKLGERGQIERRWSFLTPAEDFSSASADGVMFYEPGNFPSTGRRMQQYERDAPVLAAMAVEKLELGADANKITHLVITSCTGFSAPGIDFEIIHRCGLNLSVERTIIGFMGCYAAINGLKFARHIVRSEPDARVLVVSVELCSLHFQETYELEKMMPFLLFADGCAAALVTSKASGLRLDSFYAAILPQAADQMGWFIRDDGFDMVLSSKIPGSVGEALKAASERILGGATPQDMDLWAVHPGGRAVLDSVESVLRLPSDALQASRDVLRNHGNMSSATIMFVLKTLLDNRNSGERGCAMSFGPGLTAETMLFSTAA